jgi:hypothetical protein
MLYLGGLNRPRGSTPSMSRVVLRERRADGLGPVRARGESGMDQSCLAFDVCLRAGEWPAAARGDYAKQSQFGAPAKKPEARGRILRNRPKLQGAVEGVRFCQTDPNSRERWPKDRCAKQSQIGCNGLWSCWLQTMSRVPWFAAPKGTPLRARMGNHVHSEALPARRLALLPRSRTVVAASGRRRPTAANHGARNPAKRSQIGGRAGSPGRRAGGPGPRSSSTFLSERKKKKERKKPTRAGRPRDARARCPRHVGCYNGPDGSGL